MLKHVYRVLAFVLLFAPVSAFAQPRSDCGTRFAQDSATISMLAPDIGRGQRAAGEQIVRVITDDDERNGSCRVDLRVSRLTSDPSFPEYRLTVLGRPLEPTLNETISRASNQVRLTVPASRNGRTVNLRATAPANWGISAGRHNEQLRLSLVNSSGEIVDRLALNLIFEVPKAVDVMFVGATGRGKTSRIDLGSLSATEEARSDPFGLRVWSSSGYRVDFSSENNGTLSHRLGMDAIPYKLQLDGRDVILGRGATPFSRPNATGRTGDLYRLAVVVPARRSVAGKYKDRITVSVSAI